MRSIRKRLSLCRLVLIFGAAAIAMPIAARVSPTSSAVVIERQAHLIQPTANDNEDANGNDSKATVGRRVVRQVYYDRRRRYWEDRVERRLNEEENGDDEDAKDKAKDDEDKADSEDNEDSEEDIVERRREYWRDRLDREW